MKRRAEIVQWGSPTWGWRVSAGNRHLGKWRHWPEVGFWEMTSSADDSFRVWAPLRSGTQFSYAHALSAGIDRLSALTPIFPVIYSGNDTGKLAGFSASYFSGKTQSQAVS